MRRLIKKGTKLYSVFNNLCPKCQSSKFWPENNPFKNIFVKNGGDIGNCSNCQLKFEVELGFWYGAMYVSYAISVFISILSWVLINTFTKDISILNEILIISCSLIFMSPVVYYFSRLIWINIFISFKEN